MDLPDFGPIAGPSLKQTSYVAEHGANSLDPSKYTSLDFDVTFVERYGKPVVRVHEWMFLMREDLFDPGAVSIMGNKSFYQHALNVGYLMFCKDTDSECLRLGKPVFNRHQMQAAWSQLCLDKFDKTYEESIQELLGNTPRFMAPRVVATRTDAETWGMPELLKFAIEKSGGLKAGGNRLNNYWRDKAAEYPGLDINVRSPESYETLWMTEQGIVDVVGNESGGVVGDASIALEGDYDEMNEVVEEKPRGNDSRGGGPSFAYRPKRTESLAAANEE